MAYTVSRYSLASASKQPDLNKDELPIGFPLLVNEKTEDVVAPVLLFLAGKYAGDTSYLNEEWIHRRSAEATVADLKQWFDHLAATEGSWDEVTTFTMASYLRQLKAGRVRQTGLLKRPSTFSRHFSSLSAFLAYANARWVRANPPNMQEALALAGGRPKQAGFGEDDPRPIPREMVEPLAEVLGPLPSARGPKQSSRNRLAYEIGIYTGMRVDEICSLPASCLSAFAKTPDKGMLSLRITKTKGLVPRTVLFPVSIVEEIRKYANTERSDAVEQARKVWLGKADPEPEALLLNMPSSRAHCGKPTQAASLQRAFHDACIAVGLTKTERVTVKGNTTELTQTTHRFHDTRHTYAYWTYLALRRQDVDEATRQAPWKFIQDRLGHLSEDTTKKIYLSVFEELSGPLLNTLEDHFIAMRSEFA